jgi:hypothetical protein
MVQIIASIAATIAVRTLCAAGTGGARPVRYYYGLATRSRGGIRRRVNPRLSAHERAQISRSIAPPVVPDFTTQYGYIRGPASGSLEAMLQGKYPAAGVLP